MFHLQPVTARPAPIVPVTTLDGARLFSPAPLAPPKTKGEEIAAAYQLKMRLTSTAREKVSTLQADLLLGEISDEDKARLIEWRAYLKKMETINIQDAPGINWPESPAA